LPRQAKRATVSPASPAGPSDDAVEGAPQQSFVPLEIVVSRLVAEVTEHRIRHRALLEVLREDGVSWERYISALRSVRARDREALFGSIVLQPDAFEAEFSSWSEADAARFLFEVVPTPSEATSPKTDPKPPRRKAAAAKPSSTKD
jgi:hypothetical protein